MFEALLNVQSDDMLGGKIAVAADCLEFLQQKYFEKTSASFVVEEITKKESENGRAEARLKKYPTIDISDHFQVMVFTPNSSSFKAGKHLCICEECLKDYGSCASFSS